MNLKIIKAIKRNVKNIKNKINYITALSSVVILTASKFVYAADEPKIVSGTKSLFTDAGSWLLILDPLVAAVICGVAGLKWFAGDESEKKSQVKVIKGTFGVAVFIEVASGLITFVLKYYA